jgi:hypothetical protein
MWHPMPNHFLTSFASLLVCPWLVLHGVVLAPQLSIFWLLCRHLTISHDRAVHDRAVHDTRRRRLVTLSLRSTTLSTSLLSNFDTPL